MENKGSEWLILAGGKGTRSADPNLPKILQSVNGRTLLEIHLSNLEEAGARSVILVLSHLSDTVIQESERLKSAFPTLDISYVLDEGIGTEAALRLAARHIQGPRVGILLGDTYVDSELSYMWDAWTESKRKLAVFYHPTDHKFDSDTVAIDYKGDLVAAFEPGLQEPRLGHIFGLTGLYMMEVNSLSLLDGQITQDGSLVSKLISAVGVTNTAALPAIGYFKDTGTADRLATVIQAAKRGLRTRKRGGMVFLDRDGTLIPDLSSGRRSLSRDELNRNLVSKLSTAISRDVPLVMVTNQPAIAKGQIDFGDVYYVNNALIDILLEEGLHLSLALFCPHHPEKGHAGERVELKIACECRKPGTKMFDLSSNLTMRHLGRSLVFGDTSADAIAAKKLSAMFQEVHDREIFETLDVMEKWIAT